MRKTTTRIFSIMICIAMCFSVAIPAFALSEEFSNENYATEDLLNNQHSQLLSMQFKQKYSILVVTKTTQEIVMDYPSNYGGVYIDDDNKLHIAYVKQLDGLEDKLTDSNIIYDNVKYSFEYLTNVADILNEKMLKYSISSVSVDEINNKVEVAVDENEREKVLEYLTDTIEDFEEDSVLFKEAESFDYTDAGGIGIQKENSSGYFTLGYNAFDRTYARRGFVTCAHGVSLVGDNIKRYNQWGTGSVIGTVKNRQMHTKIDACFAEYKDPYDANAVCMPEGLLTGTFNSSEITTGMVVNKYGQASKEQSGTVLSTYFSTNVSGIVFTDQVKIDILQLHGDSGAPVVFNFIGPVTEESKRPKTLLGIATFSDESNNYHTASISKAANINSAFNLRTITGSN